MNLYFRDEMCPVSHHKSRKYHLFIREPMSNKAVTDLVGVGKVLGRRLAARGFQEASTLFGQFLLLKESEGVVHDLGDEEGRGQYGTG